MVKPLKDAKRRYEEYQVDMERFKQGLRAKMQRNDVAKARRDRITVKKFAVSFVLMLGLSVSIGAFVSPTFAKFLSSFMNQTNLDKGIENAASGGFTQQAQSSVTDQGITIAVEEILADPSRLLASYYLQKSNGEKLTEPLFGKENRIYITDAAGKEITEMADFIRGKDFSYLQFAMDEEAPNKMVFHLEVKEIVLGPSEKIKGNWKLSVPIDMEKSVAATKKLPLDSTYTSPQGLKFEMKQATYTPSTTSLNIKTSWTAEAKERIAKEAAKLTGKNVKNVLLDQYTFDYRILDQQGNVLVSSKADVGESAPIYFQRPMYRSHTEEEGWVTSFAPLNSSQKPVFVLDSIQLTEPSDFSMELDLAAAAKAPVAKSVNGVTFTVEKASSEKGELVIELTSDKDVDDLHMYKWVVTDGQGGTHQAGTRNGSFEVEQPDGTYKTVGKSTIKVKDWKDTAKKVKLSLAYAPKTYENLNWQVPIPTVK